MNLFLSILAGAVTGVLSGFGIGGGTLLILWLTLVCGMNQLQAGGINLLYFAACAIPALILHKRNGLIEKTAVLQSLVFGIPAALGAAFLASFMDVELLRKFFGVFLLIIGLRELFQKRIS